MSCEDTECVYAFVETDGTMVDIIVEAVYVSLEDGMEEEYGGTELE